MNKQIIRMYLDFRRLSWDKEDMHEVTHVTFRDSDEQRQGEFLHEDWLSMGSPKEIVVTIQPADTYDEDRRKTQDALEKARAQSERTWNFLKDMKERRDRIEPVLRARGFIK